MTDRLLSIPARYHRGLELYARAHVAPGSFLRCVLEDRLNEAVARMDRDLTIDDLRALTMFVHNELMPGTCHGSPAKVAAWIDVGRAAKACSHCAAGLPFYESEPRKDA